MARFQLHLGFLFSSPLFHRSSVDVADAEDTNVESESESEAGDDLFSSPPIVTAAENDSRDRRGYHLSVLDTVTVAVRRSLAMCSLGAGEKGSDACMDIGWPTDVQHVSHVTFDRFDGFLGLPVEFQSDIPDKVPSASVRVFGVSVESMQCSFDSRGNSVPTILLSMQRHLYSQGGLKVEGIFRINTENGLEMIARKQLNKGVMPHGVDLHCLAGLIKAWFRELPSGVLDCLPPELVMHCNAKGKSSQLVRMIPPTEAALLDWAINLMADVVEQEHYNKMNAQNMAMIFAPNMTQMIDPLISLIHSVQLMNFLRTLITKTLHERGKVEDSAVDLDREISDIDNVGTDSDDEGSFRSFEKSEVDESEFISGRSSLTMSDSDGANDESKSGYGGFYAEGLLNRLSLRKGVNKLCRHPVFLLNRFTKKVGEIDSAADF